MKYFVESDKYSLSLVKYAAVISCLRKMCFILVMTEVEECSGGVDFSIKYSDARGTVGSPCLRRNARPVPCRFCSIDIRRFLPLNARWQLQRDSMPPPLTIFARKFHNTVKSRANTTADRQLEMPMFLFEYRIFQVNKTFRCRHVHPAVNQMAAVA